MTMEVRLSREMRLMDITMIGVGAMIGAGIFVLTGIAAGVAGPALILVFFLNGIVALLTAMAYAELGSAFHDAGGGYLWVKTSLPDPNGFLGGWMSWFAHAVACSLYALGFGAYFRLVLTSLGMPEFHLGFMTLEKWLAVIACGAFSYINLRGASETGKAGNVVTVGKIVIIGGFIAMGLWVMARRPDWQLSFRPFLDHGWGSLLAAMGLTFIAFQGYEIIAQTSKEVADPKRSVPPAMFLSLLIVVPIYLLVALVAVGAVTAPEGMRVTEYLGREKELALVTAANQFLRGGGVLLLALGAAVGWVIKRAVVRILIWLRLDRLGGRVGWRAAFGKGDVRAALYNLLGGIAMLLVILVFLDNAPQILGLTVLSRMVDNVVFYLPNLGLVGLIVGIGVLLSNVVADRAEDLLEEEEFVRARLIGKILKGVLLSVVSAIALWQLGIARQIVLSAFLIAFGAIGVAFALAVGLGSAKAIQRGWEALFDKRKEE